MGKYTEMPGKSTVVDDHKNPIKIDLPFALAERVKAIYGAAEDKKRKAQDEADYLVRALLEGFLAAHKEADGRNFNLSADGKALEETPPLPLP